MKSSSNELKKQARTLGIDVKGLFTRTKINLNSKLTKYQQRKVREAIRDKLTPEKFDTILLPDRPEHYESAGFARVGRNIYTHTPTEIHITKLYFSEGDLSYYTADFGLGLCHAVLCPLNKLTEFLEKQIKIDDVDKRYDKITIREGDRNLYGSYSKFNWMKNNAEELLLDLEQYKRHGELIGHGGSFDYIQICFIQFY